MCHFTVFQSLVCATPHASFSSGQSHSLLFHLFALSPPMESLIWEVVNRFSSTSLLGPSTRLSPNRISAQICKLTRHPTGIRRSSNMDGDVSLHLRGGGKCLCLKLLTSFVSSAESPAPDLAAGRGGETTGYSGGLSSVPRGHGHAAWQLLSAPGFHIQVMLSVPLAHFLGHCKAQREKGVEVLCKAFS